MERLSDKKQHLMTGYVRRIERKYQKSIPIGIVYIIAAFYCDINEWNPDDSDEFIILSNENRTVTHKYDQINCHLVRAIIGYSEGVHYWEMKIENFHAHWCNFLGVASKEASRLCSWYNSDVNKYFWGFRCHGICIFILLFTV